ncbi:MAG: PLP-dependent aminotransferase family protein [Spirochaetales bacterium]|nr:MAG: PLP-dependent aminotransferase family protein [Spirochaetales bacterium]
MQSSMRVYKDDDTPLYVQAADALRRRIIDGEFRRGDRLPSIRRLSDELGVNPATVVAAYRILTRESLVEARAGSGAYVPIDASIPEAPHEAKSRIGPDSLPSIHDPNVHGEQGNQVDMTANAPPLDLFPLEDVKAFIVQAIDADGGKVFEYQDASGYAPLKRALALRLSSRRDPAKAVDPDDVHIVSGAQQGLDLAARVLLRRGDVAAMESPGYRGARDVFIAAGARVESVPLNAEGMDLAVLEHLAATRPLRLVYVNPSFQNPTGIVYSRRAQTKLVTLAERYGFYIVEDDLFADLVPEPGASPSFRALDEAGRVLFVKSFSKTMMPGLRIACMETPAALRERIEGAKRSVDLSSNGLMQRVLERFLSSGRYDAHIARARERYLQAADIFFGALSPGIKVGLSWEQPRGGINAWIRVPPDTSGRIFAQACLDRGCAVAPEAAFRFESSPGDGLDRHVRASFGSVPLSDVAQGGRAIAEAAIFLSTR